MKARDLDEAILEVFHRASGSYLSGEEIAQELNECLDKYSAEARKAEPG